MQSVVERHLTFHLELKRNKRKRRLCQVNCVSSND